MGKGYRRLHMSEFDFEMIECALWELYSSNKTTENKELLERFRYAAKHAPRIRIR